jgi:DNA-directed RNA polymerase specialized sigma subunit
VDLLACKPLITKAISDVVWSSGVYDLPYETEDFYSIAYLRILQSPPHDPSRGAAESTYVYRLASGAIKDAIRADEWNPISYKLDKQGEWKIRGFRKRLWGQFTFLTTVQKISVGWPFVRAKEVLEPRDWRIVEGIFLEDMTEQEVAEELGITGSYLNVRLRRILNRLRFALRGTT